MAVVIVTDQPSAETWSHDLCALEGARLMWAEGLEQLKALIACSTPDVLVFDLDQVPLDDRRVREIKKKHPKIELLIVSGRSCHPELKESLGHHIFACLAKPLDGEEFGFCLKSIHEKRRLLDPDLTDDGEASGRR